MPRSVRNVPAAPHTAVGCRLQPLLPPPVKLEAAQYNQLVKLLALLSYWRVRLEYTASALYRRVRYMKLDPEIFRLAAPNRTGAEQTSAFLGEGAVSEI
eukprot:6188696-Pleurochrysis_carterae.AAC.2